MRRALGEEQQALPERVLRQIAGRCAFRGVEARGEEAQRTTAGGEIDCKQRRDAQRETQPQRRQVTQGSTPSAQAEVPTGEYSHRDDGTEEDEDRERTREASTHQTPAIRAFGVQLKERERGQQPEEQVFEVVAGTSDGIAREQGHSEGPQMDTDAGSTTRVVSIQQPPQHHQSAEP